jgi:tetratricopeptide (TPR) repeat protein
MALVGREKEQKDLLDRETELSAATLLNGLGSYRSHALVDYGAARPLLERALAIRKKLLGPDDSDTTTSLNNLAMLLDLQHEFAAAEPLLREVLAIRERTRASERDIALSRHNLATVLRKQGKLAGARPLFAKSLRVFKKLLASDDPESARDIIMSLHGVAQLLRAEDKLARAKRLGTRALGVCEKVLGLCDRRAATILELLARIDKEEGDPTRAQLLLERALPIFESTLGRDHPETIRVRDDLAALRTSSEG